MLHGPTSRYGGTTPAQVPVQLRQVFPVASFVGCANIRVTGATANSRECQPGMLFAAIPGTHVDGHDFAADAVARGATSLLVSRPLPEITVPQCVVSDPRRAFALLCSQLWRNPSNSLKTLGITGTNGKTTTTWLCRSILQNAGQQTGLLGTIEYHDGLLGERSTLTTPDASTISNWLGRMVHQRTTHAALEVSSHALDQDRVAGTKFDVAAITNITQDHFDYHLNFAAYRRSKWRIIEHVKPNGCVILNADDPASWPLPELLKNHSQITFGIDSDADVTANIIDQSLAGTLFELRLPHGTLEVQTPLLGKHNVANCLTASAAACHLGLTVEQIAAGLRSLRAVPGRMEAVECGQLFSVFVDYAHTDDALRRCVRGLRKVTPGRVIVVYGAGGDRDRLKRPLLTQAASDADIAILTSDNPRSEDPQQIIRDCLAGTVAGRPQPIAIADRESAIHAALDLARPGDSVLIAGKGHETEQIIGTERHHFDDREVVRQYLTSIEFPTAVFRPPQSIYTTSL